MGFKEGGLRGSLRNVSVGASIIPDSAVLQLDPSQLNAADGDPISTWPDESGSGNDLTGDAVTYKENIQNGEPILRFSGSEILDNSSPSIAQPLTWIAAVAVDASGRQVIGSSVNADDQRAQFRYNNGDYAYFHGTTTLSGGSSDTNFHIITNIADGANSVLRVDGTELISGDAGPHTWGGFRVGITYAGSSAFDGDQGEHLVCGANLESTGELTDQEQRIANKYGVSLA